MSAEPSAVTSYRGAHSRLPLPRNVLLGFVIAGITVALIAWLFTQSLQNRRLSADAITHELQVAQTLQSVLSAL
ncbi:MAG TPA: hypothetical protein VKT19_02655, partial [Steroidobacteraceae bacterium]|nr:hypothetical protein [Steroidobacteraceae bacterium]